MYECRCDERPKTKTEEFTRLVYIVILGGLEHLKIETRLIDERFDIKIRDCFKIDVSTVSWEEIRQLV